MTASRSDQLVIERPSREAGPGNLAGSGAVAPAVPVGLRHHLRGQVLRVARLTLLLAGVAAP